MAEQEGVIKFDLDWRPGPPATGVDTGIDPAPLDRWRARLMAAGLIGQDPARYDGYGFGNLSMRVAAGFVITGTQTGALPALSAEHYALVTAWDVAANRIVARGPVKPSSEALTHATLYGLDPDIGVVFHGHGPSIWTARDRLGLPATAADVPYGTPAMARAVARLFEDTAVADTRVFAMAGHEDGIVSFGRTADQAGTALLDALEAVAV